MSVWLHLTVSMKRTRTAIDFSPQQFIAKSVLRPLTCVLPSLLLLSSWSGMRTWPAQAAVLSVWMVSTVFLMYLVGLTTEDRDALRTQLSGLTASRNATLP